MATTLYMKSTASALQPGRVDSGWTFDDHGTSSQADTSDTSSGLNFWSQTYSSIHSVVIGQAVYGPIAAQTISGTVTPVIYGADTTFINLYISAAAVWIATPAGALRATLLGKTNDPNGTNWNTTMQGYNMGAITLTSGAATAGDYLVIEAGLADTSFTNSESGRIGAGNSRTRFTFSQTINLTVPKGASPTTLWVGQPLRRSV